MKATPPFYSNHEDNMRCMLASYGMIVEHFEGSPQNWDELIKLTGYKPGVAAWTIKPIVIVTLLERGYTIRMIEAFDYKKYLEQGEPYIDEHFDEEAAVWVKENSNILKLRNQIPTFLEHAEYEMRSPQLADIDQMLDDGMLVNVQLNSRKLNGKDGFVSHAIVVFDKDDKGYIAHDPGDPPGIQSRRIPRELMLESMGGLNNTTEVTGYRLNK